VINVQIRGWLAGGEFALILLTRLVIGNPLREVKQDKRRSCGGDGSHPKLNLELRLDACANQDTQMKQGTVYYGMGMGNGYGYRMGIWFL
jgi:hypothetical protein